MNVIVITLFSLLNLVQKDAGPDYRQLLKTVGIEDRGEYFQTSYQTSLSELSLGCRNHPAKQALLWPQQ